MTRYATPNELVTFANRVRAAGGGDAIEALFPAVPQQANACLIAKALNFDCEVYCRSQDGWCIAIRDKDVAERIASELHKTVTVAPHFSREGELAYEIGLPAYIGASAAAYDDFVDAPVNAPLAYLPFVHTEVLVGVLIDLETDIEVWKDQAAREGQKTLRTLQRTYDAVQTELNSRKDGLLERHRKP